MGLGLEFRICPKLQKKNRHSKKKVLRSLKTSSTEGLKRAWSKPCQP